MSFSGKIAIAGVHEYESRWAPDKTSFQIMGECARDALADAGLGLSDVDGLFCATMTMGAMGPGARASALKISRMCVQLPVPIEVPATRYSA